MSKVIYGFTIFATVIGAVLAFWDHLVVAALTALLTLLIFALRYIYDNWSLTFRPRILKPTDFMKRVDIKRLKVIKVLGHTGGDLYTAIYQKLDDIRIDDALKNRIHVQVIVRHPRAEVTRRFDQIEETKKRIDRFRAEGFNIEIRFYQDLPSHRGIICEYSNGKRLVYLSAYYWPKTKNLSKAFPYPMIIRDSVNKVNPLVGMLESWMNHYWGGGKIHTIIFDFDDTLAPTMDIQVAAWIEAIESALERNKISEDHLSTALRESRSNRELYRQAMKDLFIEHQMAEQIINEILPGIDRDTKKHIDDERFNIRKRLLVEKGILFAGVEAEIKQLGSRYQLAIVTATSSRVVSKFLDKWGITEYFSIILGKDDPKHEWENVYSKAIRLIEVSGLTGVPLDRLVMIGDNTADYEAANQVGVTFIEAAQTAQLVGKESLIKPAARKGRSAHKRFFSFSDKTLDGFIEELNRDEMGD